MSPVKVTRPEKLFENLFSCHVMGYMTGKPVLRVYFGNISARMVMRNLNVFEFVNSPILRQKTRLLENAIDSVKVLVPNSVEETPNLGAGYQGTFDHDKGQKSASWAPSPLDFLEVSPLRSSKCRFVLLLKGQFRDRCI